MRHALVVAAGLAGLLVACEDERPPADLGVDLTAGVISCASAAQCPQNLPMCDPTSHVCVGCIDSFQTCGPMLTCDPLTHTCVPADPQAKCTRTADCPRPGFDPITAVSCLLDAGLCVECVSNTDCVVPDTCQPDNTCKTIPDGGGP